MWQLVFAIVSSLWVAPVNAVMTSEEVFALASRSVVTVVTLNREQQPVGLGSGVVIRSERVVTNCHVLAGGQAVTVFYQERKFAGRVVDSMVGRDLCLLDVAGLNAPGLEIGNSKELRVGQHVFALGAPHGLSLIFTEGLISSLRADTELKLIQTSAPISPGSSGGALLTSDGRLIGITTLQHATGQNLNFAVPADWARQFRSLQGR